MNLGLVLTGGGARAAYQVGVIKALSEILGKDESPFKVMTGVSAGAINAAYLISRADQFKIAAQGLWDLWTRLDSDKVYRSDAVSIAGLGSKWLGTVGMGGLLGKEKANHLLDTTPLRSLLSEELHLDRLPAFFKNGVLKGASVSATNYLTGTAISFFDGDDSVQPWVRSTRLGVRVPLTLEHVMASSAIPVFFPPENIEGALYGDGCIRLSSPLSPSIHLGAEKIIAVGIRYMRTSEQIVEMNQAIKKSNLTIAEIGGVLLNAVFLDSLENDAERLERINQTISILTPEQRKGMPTQLRPVPLLVLRPSQDLGQLARGTLKEFPRMIRFLLKGLGAKEDKGWDLLSYLAFEAAYTGQLIELGYLDTIRKKAVIEQFVAN